LGAALFLFPSRAAEKKDLWVVDGKFVWGRSEMRIVGMEYPGVLTDESVAAEFTRRSSDYPAAGADVFLIHCQSPGHRFFGENGKDTPEGLAFRLRRVLDDIGFFSGDVIVNLFDPDPTCRLASEQAYLDAALWVVDSLRGEDGFILSICDRCDSPEWTEGELPLGDFGLVDRIAAAIHEASPGRVVAAGARSEDRIRDLVENAPSVDALIGRVARPGYGKGTLSSAKKPVLEIVDLEQATDEELFKAFDTVENDASYGFVVELREGTDEEERAETLARFGDVLNRYMIERSSAVPPDPEDTYSLSEGEKEEGFVSLFNGKNLEGWVQLTDPGNFVVRDGAIELVRMSGGWLRSYYPYDDFVFRGEYTIDSGKNSGIWFRAQLNGRNSRLGFEFQILGDGPDVPPSTGGVGSIYSVRAPDKNLASPPGEWNAIEVTCKGPTIRVVWNGEEVHNVRYEDYPLLKDRRLGGYIGLTDHRGHVKFRNLRIKPLD
jgi:hypothetical protein